jgi:dTDP-glucose 4,6-dehydratase
MAEKYFIIGSNSFSGASFVDFLLKNGNPVIGVSRSVKPHRAFLPYCWNGNDSGFEFYNYDLNSNLEEIVSLVNREKPSFVVNFAAQGMVAQSWKNPDHWFMTNVVSTVNLHERLRHCDFLEKYVHVTTPEVYGSTNGFIKEDAPFNPSTPYAVSRAAADMSLKTFFDAYQFPVVFTRAANVYGPGQQLYRIIPRTILSILTGKKLQLHGGGFSKRSFIHIRDVASATHKIATQGEAGQTYHISTNDLITIRELVEKICHLLSVDFDACVEVVGERLGKDAAYMLESSKVRLNLSWGDEISLDEGLSDCIEWVKLNLEDLKALPWDYIHKP